MGTIDARAAVVAWGRWLLDNKAHFHYAEVRPIPYHKPITAAFPITTDCSGFVSLCYYLAGVLNDPNGERWNGQGYTGTLLANGKLIPANKVLPGDVVVWGPGTGWHTALVISAGPDPVVISHGQEGDPSTHRVSADTRTPVRYLRFDTRAAGMTMPPPANS